MAWNPTRCLLKGELENTINGRITGWMKFAGMKEKVTFDLIGDFDPSIRGTRIRFSGTGSEDDELAESYMYRFTEEQTGNAGDIVAGDNPRIEWFSKTEGRMMIELEAESIEVIGQLLPFEKWEFFGECVNGQT